MIQDPSEDENHDDDCENIIIFHPMDAVESWPEWVVVINMKMKMMMIIMTMMMMMIRPTMMIEMKKTLMKWSLAPSENYDDDHLQNDDDDPPHNDDHHDHDDLS